jgi:molybdopterin molybdotransferase
MISFREALDLLLEQAPRMDAEACRLEHAHVRVLRQEVRADRTFPPFDRVMMDGYALRSCELAGSGIFRVSGSAPAGKAAGVLGENRGDCLEVMTGAPLPSGADCIVPVEDVTHMAPDRIQVSPSYQFTPGMFIHRAGSDNAAGEILLQPGCLLGSREIGVAASCGAAVLQVSKLPRITIIPTGDELVAVDSVPAQHQIRQSNGHAIRAALMRGGFVPTLTDPLGDDAGADDLRVHLESSDWLILTGAISKGARDFLPRLLDDLGCKPIFHGVAQRPGKPAGFWLGPRGQAIMALPGNPVSALTGLHAFVIPAIAAASGKRHAKPRLVVADAGITGLENMTLHLPVIIGDDGRARAAATSNSGDFTGLLRSDGFITMPPRGGIFAAFPFTPWL